MTFVAEYGLFFAKIFTLVIALLAVTAGVIAIVGKGKIKGEKLKVKKLNQKYQEMSDILNAAILDKHGLKALLKTEKKKQKTKEKDNPRKKTFVLDFKGDIKASDVNTLRQSITAILTVATPADEVVVCLESAGGMVHAYGLAASQLQRIKQKKIPLVVCIDKVAASGGYLMACVADRILAAPFAIVGSIGVIAQLPNFNRLLKKNHIDFEQITAGEFKRTLTIFGENTDKARQKFKEEIEETHDLFKNFITDHRPQVKINEVATGEHWYGQRAQALRLIDDLLTSDDYLLQASDTADLYQVSYQRKKTLSDKIASTVQATTEKLWDVLSRN